VLLARNDRNADPSVRRILDIAHESIPGLLSALPALAATAARRAGLAALRRPALRALDQMIRPLLPQLGRFLSVGLLNGLISLLAIYACKGFFHVGDVAANAIGYAAGLTTSFTLNSRWTFAYSGRQLPALIKFLLVAAVAYGMNLLAVLVLIEHFGMNSYIAQALGIPPYVLTSYLASKFIVFRMQREPHNKSP
jgi:putative flippase GtrA